VSEQQLPKHRNPFHDRNSGRDRSRIEAVAPYNFVPLPDKIVEAAPLPDRSCFHLDRLTGRIDCELTTESPLYVRCALTEEQFAVAEREQHLTPKGDPHDQAKHTPAFFYTADPESPVIPGSSLRGVLRALVEIAAYAKVERVTDQSRFFFRAVAALSTDPLRDEYSYWLRGGRNVDSGYLVRRLDGWYIQPARLVERQSLLKIKEQFIPTTFRSAQSAENRFIRLGEPEYWPQWWPVSFNTRSWKDKQGYTQYGVGEIGDPGTVPGGQDGYLVTSGNMMETGYSANNTRKSHTVIGAPDPGAPLLKIADWAIADYKRALTQFQRETRGFGRDGMLTDGRPVFFLPPVEAGGEVTHFGHSPNFRIPALAGGGRRAATPRDFVPESLRSATQLDLAEAIFGVVPRDGAGGKIIAGRVSVSDAHLVPDQQEIWYSQEPIAPQILASPKPETFQHYLVQEHPDRYPVQGRNGRVEERSLLTHYASPTPEQTVIRGHKLYWHKGAHPPIFPPAEENDEPSDTQTTRIRPVRAGVRFTFRLRFENLTQVELGALLWVLALGSDERYRLKLGMGKPLGMGAFRLNSRVTVSDPTSQERRGRYECLLNANGWHTAERFLDETSANDCVRAFEAHVLSQLGVAAQVARLEQLLRIRCLLALLTWRNGLDREQTRYLEIEHGPAGVNEYRGRPVLPTPLAVIGWEQRPERRSTPPEDRLRSPAKRELQKASRGIPPHRDVEVSQRSSQGLQKRHDRDATPISRQAESRQPNQPLLPLPDKGGTLPGSRSGEHIITVNGRKRKGLRVQFDTRPYLVPGGFSVIGFMSPEDGAGLTTARFLAEIVRREEDRAAKKIFLFVRPAKQSEEGQP
jgi:CRISPR-associated protein (TIGR03986 family)